MAFGNNADLNARTLAITTDIYLDKQVENMMRSSPIMAAMKSKGRISKVDGGTQEQRIVKYRRQTLKTLSVDFGNVTYSRLNRRVNVVMPPRAYYMDDAQTIQEQWINTGPNAKVKISGTIDQELMDDFVYAFPEEFYKDGNAAGQTDRIHGWESCLSHSGTIAAGRLGSPNDSYLGQSTALGVRGSWGTSQNFPNGSGETGYHYWSPYIWIYNDDSFTGSTATYQDSCLHVARLDQLFSTKRGYKRDMGLLNTGAYHNMASKVETKESLRTERGRNTSLLVSLGFGETIYYEGVEYVHEPTVPSNDPLSASRLLAGYTLSLKGLELRHWSPKLFHRLENLPLQATNLLEPHIVASMCNLFTNPQCVSKIVNSGSTDATLTYA